MNEEEVRTLFHELLSKNIIKGYKTLYDAANCADYDAAFTYELSFAGSIIEEDGDKIGIPKVVKFNMGKSASKITLECYHLSRVGKLTKV